MNGGRITSEEKTTLSTYITIGVIVVMCFVALYFFILTQREKKESLGFDANRPLPSDVVLRERLTPEQYAIVRGNGSETPFQGKYWNNSRAGIYVDLIGGQPLFTSVDKYDAKIGMLTFSKPISPHLLMKIPDNSDDMKRTELRAKHSNARLGYLFADPASPTGQRYMIYSGAVRFIPWEEMKASGYGSDLPLVRKQESK